MTANAQAMCTSFKQDLLNGLHAFGASVVRGATTKDTFYAALYLVNSGLGATTTSYAAATTEVSGTNYSAGGVAVTNATAPTTSGTTAYWTPSASIVYTTVTLTSAFDCMLLYNYTAGGTNAVGVFTFGSQTITAGTLTLTMPSNTSSTALIQLA